MTKGDVIRCMSDKALSTYLYNHDFCKHPVQSDKQNWCDMDCKQCIEKFIQEDCVDVSL